MSLGTILLIILILMLVGAFPSWPHSKSWGYGTKWRLGFSCSYSTCVSVDGAYLIQIF